MIYIATDIAGRGVRHVLAFDNRLDFYRYALEVIERANNGDRWPRRSYSVDRLCDCLFDRGVGFGSRSHRRVSRRDAYRLARDGAERVGF